MAFRGFRVPFALFSVIFFVAWLLIPVPRMSHVSAALGMLSIYGFVITGVTSAIVRYRAGKRLTRSVTGQVSAIRM